MQLKRVTRIEQLELLIDSLQPNQAFRLEFETDFAACADIIRNAIRGGRLEAILTIFNGRKDEYWRVTRMNVTTDSIGAPIIIMYPGTEVALPG